MSRLLNTAAVKRYALDTAAKIRPAVGFERVSQDFIDKIEGKVRATIIEAVRAQPSLGITLK